MTSFGTPCTKDIMSAPLLEEGLPATDCRLENGEGYAGTNTQRAELSNKLYRTARAMAMVTVLCLGILLLYHNCNINNDLGSLYRLQAYSSSNQEIDVDTTVEINMVALAGQAAGATFAPADTSLGESSTADPKDHYTGYISEGLSPNSSTSDIRKSGGDSGSQQERTHEQRKAQVDQGKSPAHLAPAPPQGQDSSSSVDASSTDDSASPESLGGRLTYEQAVAKGKKYIQLMKQQPRSKDQARSWTEKEVRDQGWVGHSESGLFQTPSGIVTLLKSFAPQFITPSSQIPSDWRHTHPIEGSLFKKPILPTQAFYQQIINARAGVIFITNARGPRAEGAKQNPPGSRLPELQHVSDFSYMAWSEAAKAFKRSRKTLQKVVRCSVDNKDTKHIIAKVTNEAKPASLPYAKRMSFKAGSEQYCALLGTENGVGVAYLLAEHQTSLGWKVVDSIEVFYDEGYAYIVFNIRDAIPKSDKSGAAGPSHSQDIDKRGRERALPDAAPTAKKRQPPAESDDGPAPSSEIYPYTLKPPRPPNSLRNAMNIGEESADMVLGSPSTAFTPSPFVSVDDLAENGYKLDQTTSLRADSVPIAAQAVARILKTTRSSSGLTTTGEKRSADTHLDVPSANNQLHKRWPFIYGNMNNVGAKNIGQRNALDLIDASSPRASRSRWVDADNLRAERFELTESQPYRTDRLTVASEAVAKIIPASVHVPAPQVFYRVWSRTIQPKLSLSAFHHTNLLLSTGKVARVAGNAQQNIVAWHDMAYLSRLEAVGNDQMRLLNHIIKADVDIPTAFDILAELMGSLTPNFDARRTYVEGTREFFVLLGIVPGQEVTEFLLTHRETLGMKKVSQISLWYEQTGGHTFPVLWYELDDVVQPIVNPPGWRDASGSRPQ